MKQALPEPPAAGAVGSCYLPLSEGDIGRIHEAVLTVLETVGFADAIPSCIEALTGAGAVLGEDGRIRFPRSLVRDTISRAARNITLHGQDPRHDLHLDGSHVHFGTAGVAVNLVDAAQRIWRETRLQDIYDAARLVEGLDNIHFFQRPMVARDIADPLELDFNTLYACVAGTTKHVGTSFTVRENVKPALEMLHMIAGGEEKFRARPFVSSSSCFVVSPMKFAEDACGVMEECVRGGLPILVLSVGQAGITAPADLAGAVVQTVAEVLAGLVYVNALKPGHPAIFAAWPFASDPHTGAMAGGSPQQALLGAACAQMARFYDLPSSTAAGMTDAGLPDSQSGYEKGITDMLAALSGAHLVYEAAGMHGSLLGFCLESLIIDNDMLGHCLQSRAGMAAGDEQLSASLIARTCLGGPGHYLGSGKGQPGSTTAPGQERWQFRERDQNGLSDIVSHAVAEKKRLLAERFPRHITRGMDDRLRARFGDLIRLPRGAMGG
jgi:trimethylamine--corrinoid protein Co-methyltransferase